MKREKGIVNLVFHQVSRPLFLRELTRARGKLLEDGYLYEPVEDALARATAL